MFLIPLIAVLLGVGATVSFVGRNVNSVVGSATGQMAIPTQSGVLSDMGQVLRDARTLMVIAGGLLILWYVLPLVVRK